MIQQKVNHFSVTIFSWKNKDALELTTFSTLYNFRPRIIYQKNYPPNEVESSWFYQLDQWWHWHLVIIWHIWLLQQRLHSLGRSKGNFNFELFCNRYIGTYKNVYTNIIPKGVHFLVFLLWTSPPNLNKTSTVLWLSFIQAKLVKKNCEIKIRYRTGILEFD